MLSENHNLTNLLINSDPLQRLKLFKEIFFRSYISYHVPDNTYDDNNAKNKKWKYKTLHFENISKLRFFFTDKTPLRAQKRIILSFKLPRFYFDIFYCILFQFKKTPVLSRNFKTRCCKNYFLGWIVSSQFVENSACQFAAHIFVERVRSLTKFACS